MNILYINNSVHLGGDTKCILKLAKEFKNAGNNVIIASKGGVMEKKFSDIGVEHYKIGNVMNKSLFNIIKVVKEIREIVKLNNIDVIHSHHRMTTLLCKIAIKNSKVKLIHTQHLCINDKFKLTKIALNKVRVITVSEEAKNILVKKSNLDPTNITTIYNTIDNIKSNGKIDEKLIELKEKGYFIVGQVSRIIDYKGIYDFVDIAEKTIKENDNIRFVFIGDGPEKVDLEKYIKEKSLEDKVFLLGSKNNVMEHLEYLDLFILCSYIEGLPLSPIEAFSKKIPVIGTNIGGTNEEINNGINGYLVETKDIEKFKEKIIYLYNDKIMLSKLGENAYKTYIEKFNLENYVNNHKKLYEI